MTFRWFKTLSKSSFSGPTLLLSWMRSWLLVSTSFLIMSGNINVQIYCLVQDGCLSLLFSLKIQLFFPAALYDFWFPASLWMCVPWSQNRKNNQNNKSLYRTLTCTRPYVKLMYYFIKYSQQHYDIGTIFYYYFTDEETNAPSWTIC